MHKNKKREAARPRKTPRALTVIIVQIPPPLRPVLAASCAQWKQRPKEYALDALLSALRGDVDFIYTTSKETLKKFVEGGRA